MSSKRIEKVAFGLGEPPRADMPWRIVAALVDGDGKVTRIKIGECDTRDEAEAALMEIRADCLATLERMQQAGLVGPGPLSRFVTDVH